MLFLTSTTDLIQVVTTAAGAGTCNAHASWADVTGSPPAVTVGRTNTAISTASTTTIVGSPAASTSRTIKELKISNEHATLSNTITLQHVVGGGTVITLESVTLLPGERIGYIEGVGIRVFDSAGREKLQLAQTYPGNSNTADVVASAADTYLTGSSLLIPTLRVQTGSGFKWRFRVTKTAAGVAAPTFNIRTGTAGAVGDAARCLHTGVAQTAVVDTGFFDMEANFRVAGSSAVLQSVLDMRHTSADAVGLGTFHTQTLSAAFDATPSGTTIGVSCNPGAAGVWTFQLISIEAYGLIV